MMKKVMVKAWEIAKKGQKKFGGKVKEYFQQALIIAWKEVKEVVKQEVFAIEVVKQEVFAIKEWFLKKDYNLSANQTHAVKTTGAFVIKKETEKAYLLEAHHSDYGTVEFWAPKSVCLTQQEYKKSLEPRNAMQELCYKGKLIQKAKMLGIKGIKKNMKVQTIESKIAQCQQV